MLSVIMISGSMIDDRTVMPKKVRKVERLAVTFSNTVSCSPWQKKEKKITRLVVVNSVSRTEKQDSLVC